MNVGDRVSVIALKPGRSRPNLSAIGTITALPSEADEGIRVQLAVPDDSESDSLAAPSEATAYHHAISAEELTEYRSWHVAEIERLHRLIARIDTEIDARRPDTVVRREGG